MGGKELTVLRLLLDNPKGLFGSQMVHLSNGELPRGTVYVMLNRMLVRGWLTSDKNQASVVFHMDRTIYVLAEDGKRAYEDFLAKHKLRRIE